MFDNDLEAFLVFSLLFLSSVVCLLFVLAWLEQPASERWHPRWWDERRLQRVSALPVGRHRRDATAPVVRAGVPRQ